MAGTHDAVPLPGETLTGQTPEAYRTTALLVLLTAMLQLVVALLLDQFLTIVLFRLVIDSALALALFKLWPGARAFMLTRAFLGALFTLSCASVAYGINAASVIGMILPSLGYFLSVFLVLTGRTTTMRVVVALASYIVLCLVPIGYDLFMSVSRILLSR